MSEFLAEAQVIVRPDTKAFRAELLAQLTAATRGLTVPVPVTAGVAAAGALSSTQGLLVASRGATVAVQQLAGAEAALDTVTKKATVSQAGLRKGFLATGLAAAGARGATLAASSSFLLGAVAATALVKSLQAFASLETQLNVFKVTTGATADELERVAQTARQLGADITLPAVSSADAAAAMTELAKAGLSVEDALAGARGVLQLSTAAQISTGEAAEFAANALNSFGLAGDQATRVADVLANAANSAQGSIQDFGIAFQQASAVARQVGFSLEETAVTLTLLAQNGLRGSDAGTSLRVALLRLVNPTKAAAAVIEDLGIQIRDANGNIRPDVFVQFGEATRSFTPAMRDAALATVFGADAIRAVAIASREGRAGLLEVTTQINEQGTASELAGARTQGLAGQAEALKNNFATAAVEAGRLTAILAGPLIVATNALVLAFRNVISPFTALVNLIEGFQGPDFDPATASTAEFLDKLADLRKEMEDAGSIGEALVGKKLTTALQQGIGALEQQRAEFKALGLDVSALDVLIERLRGELEGLGSSEAGKKVARTLSPLQEQAKATRELIKAAARDGIDTTALKRSLREIEDELANAAEMARIHGAALARGFNEGAKDLGKPVVNILRNLREDALDIDIAGGSPQEQIANLRKQEAQLRERIEALAGAPQKRLEAKEELERVLDEIASIQEAEKRSAEAKAAKIAADSLDSDQAVADALAGDRAGLENLIARASGTASLKDDIRFTKALRDLIERQIAEASKRIKDVDVRRQFLAAANRLLVQLVLDIKRDTRQMMRDIQAALREEQERFQTGIELDIELADLNENTKRRIKLRQDLIRALLKERRVLKLTGNALKENRNEVARIRAEIEKIRGEQKDTGKSFQEMTFEFLQQQQGFAANLFGNLIPAGATQGLVGGSSLPVPGRDVAVTAGVARASDRGVGPGQFGELIAINSRMLDVLIDIAGGSAHPEARKQRRTQGGSMDTLTL